MVGGDRPGAVRIDGLTKRFGALLANDDVSFSIPAGRVLGLVGENGAGKTTVMNSLAGIYVPERGTISIGGTPLQLGSPSASVAAGIGMVHQQFKLVETLTGAENLSLAAGRGRWLQSSSGTASDKLMAELGFSIDLSARVWQMSLAVRQQLEILRALAVGARVLILDEPTSVLSPPETVSLFRIIRAIAEAGRAVVLISHKLGEVLEVTDDLVVMRSGRVVHEGPTTGMEMERLARLIVGERTVDSSRRPSGPLGAPVLEVDGLAVDGDLGLPAVRDARLQVRAGELVVIVGVAGNGQTELLQAIGGMRPYRGTVTPDTRPERRFAYIPAQHLGVGLAPGMSVQDNAVLGQQRRSPFGWWLRRRSVRRRGREVADRFGVTSPLGAPVRWLSGGNLQRLVLGRELHGDPGLIVADYPTRGLDVASASQIRRALVARANAGAAVLVSSEELEESLEIAHRILVMHRGQIVAEHDPRQVDLGVLGQQMTAGHA